MHEELRSALSELVETRIAPRCSVPAAGTSIVSSFPYDFSIGNGFHGQILGQNLFETNNELLKNQYATSNPQSSQFFAATTEDFYLNEIGANGKLLQNLQKYTNHIGDQVSSLKKEYDNTVEKMSCISARLSIALASLDQLKCSIRDAESTIVNKSMDEATIRSQLKLAQDAVCNEKKSNSELNLYSQGLLRDLAVEREEHQTLAEKLINLQTENDSIVTSLNSSLVSQHIVHNSQSAIIESLRGDIKLLQDNSRVNVRSDIIKTCSVHSTGTKDRTVHESEPRKQFINNKRTYSDIHESSIVDRYTQSTKPAGGSVVDPNCCLACGEKACGLMVQCCQCLNKFHSVCARKQTKGLSESIHGIKDGCRRDGFCCQDCTSRTKRTN